MDIVPDYIPVDSTDTNYARMSLETQRWVEFLHKLIIAAEHDYIDATIDIDIRSIDRDGINYYVSTYEHVEYLIQANPQH